MATLMGDTAVLLHLCSPCCLLTQCRYLRNKYNVQRRDVFRPGQEPDAAPES